MKVDGVGGSSEWNPAENYPIPAIFPHWGQIKIEEFHEHMSLLPEAASTLLKQYAAAWGEDPAIAGIRYAKRIHGKLNEYDFGGYTLEVIVRSTDLTGDTNHDLYVVHVNVDAEQASVFILGRLPRSWKQ